MQYRREIDGLRALAVLPVLLFHAGFQAFGGGYVGVDIFFVISGYLITSIILAELQTNTFSVVKFYERRARRILPALFLVMLASLPFAWLWMSPTGLEGFSKSVVAVALFLSNILFWKEAGYFATANELKPLLHTWSLAVEEQYYVLFPLFLMLAWRFVGKRWIIGTLFLAALASLAISEWALTRFAAVSFYLLPTRGWELLIGALAAFYLLPRGDERAINLPLYQAASLLGLSLITYSIFAFDKFTPFPGIYALPPTIGAVLIVLFANPQNLVGKLLGSRWLVGIGLISYSTYLWHQPLFSFARYSSIEEPSKMMYLLLILVSLLLAYLTWKFVETPFRNKNIIKRKQIFWFGLLGSLFFITVGLIGVYNTGFEKRFNMPTSLSTSFGISPAAWSCFDKPKAHIRNDWLCDIGSRQTNPSFIVFGDSHSRSLFDAFNEAGNKANKHGEFIGVSGCPALSGIHKLEKDEVDIDCNLINKRVYDYVKATKISKVFLIGKWSWYTYGEYDGLNGAWIGITKDSKREKALSRAAFETGLKQTVAAYASIGVQLYIVEQVPVQRLGVKDLYYKIYASTHQGSQKKVSESIRESSVSKQQHLRLQSFVSPLFKQHAQAGQLNLINFDNIFCDVEKCLIGTKEHSYYFDNNHLTTAGGRMVVDEIVKHIKQ